MTRMNRSAEELARLEAKYGPFPTLGEVLERRLEEDARRRERAERRRRLLGRFLPFLR